MPPPLIGGKCPSALAYGVVRYRTLEPHVKALLAGWRAGRRPGVQPLVGWRADRRPGLLSPDARAGPLAQRATHLMYGARAAEQTCLNGLTPRRGKAGRTAAVRGRPAGARGVGARAGGARVAQKQREEAGRRREYTPDFGNIILIMHSVPREWVIADFDVVLDAHRYVYGTTSRREMEEVGPLASGATANIPRNAACPGGRLPTRPISPQGEGGCRRRQLMHPGGNGACPVLGRRLAVDHYVVPFRGNLNIPIEL
ncbi:hypothetical protein GGX14DRAFT_673476 [Mycena pura]|uniref:Uncharacterized protein n=1 Tax=Mycena pura TaxID=153505 RepID=A0AAD6UW15_9AGAR|nr:hypothetical protein GGX14DRAFT_673476 [Mycena pura]